MEFSDEELKVHKACCEQILKEEAKVMNKLKGKELVLIKNYNLLMSKINENDNNIQRTKKILVEIEKIKHDIVSVISLKQAIEMIFVKNKDRAKFINDLFDKRGIYNQKVDKKVIKNIVKENLTKVSDENFTTKKNGLEILFFGTKVIVSNGFIDFSLEENKKAILKLDENLIANILNNYPASIKTIGGDLLLNLKLKNILLQRLAIFVFEQRSTKSIFKINRDLGGLLKIDNTSQPESVGEYIFAVENLFNILIKRELCTRYPNFANEINLKLKCNENSKYI